MPEALQTTPREQYLKAHDTAAAEDVFDGVYQSLADKAKNSPTQRREFTGREVESVAVNPALEFVEARFAAAKRTIEPLANQPTRSSEVSDRFMHEATVEAKREHDGNPRAAGVRVGRAQRVVSGFIDRASTMVASDPDPESKTKIGLTVKLFFDRLEYFKRGLSSGYNDLVAKNDEPTPSQKTKDEYEISLHETLTGRPNVEEQERGSFVHVNRQRPASESSINERYYISPKLNGQPGEVVKTWTEAADSLGLGDKLYYKVAQGLSRRYDTVVAFASPETVDDVERAVQEFTRRCDPELLSDTIIPTGIEVAKGIARSPEPDKLNTLLRYRGKEMLSYNELVSALAELALRRASYEYIQQGVQPDQVTPKVLSEVAKPYFVQFIELSGLDPAMMKAAT